MRFQCVSEVARSLGVAPRVVSDLFYQRLLDDGACPVVGGRRLIPDDYIVEIERVLRGRPSPPRNAAREASS